MERFDVVVIGSGPGGHSAALRAAQLGLKVALIERDKEFGGTCLLHGCIPTKALLHCANLYQQIGSCGELGIRCKLEGIDLVDLQRYKKMVIKRLSLGLNHLFKRNGVRTICGVGRVKSPGIVEVSTQQEVSEICAKDIVIATGASQRTLPGLKIDGKGIITYMEALELSEVPGSILIVGAGSVGIEFASIFHSFGSKVTLVEVLPSILPMEDREISAELAKILSRRGMAIWTASQVDSVRDVGGRYEVTISSRDGIRTLGPIEKILVAVGRRPNSQGIGLEDAGVRFQGEYVQVDSSCQTSQPGIHAIGDVTPSPQLAYVASAQGVMVAERIRGLPARRIDYRNIPVCTHCNPEVAHVGLTEEGAKEFGYKLKVGRFPFHVSGKACADGRREGFIKVISQEGSGEILGVHILGPSASELIAQGVVAMRCKMKVDELAYLIQAHPTLAEGVVEAAREIVGCRFLL
jgi:dihydrolipoamide dehydrogenase